MCTCKKVQQSVHSNTYTVAQGHEARGRAPPLAAVLCTARVSPSRWQPKKAVVLQRKAALVHPVASGPTGCRIGCETLDMMGSQPVDVPGMTRLLCRCAMCGRRRIARRRRFA